MIVQINSVEQTENVYNMIAENEMLRAVAERCTEFINVDIDELDVEQIECVAQTESFKSACVVRAVEYACAMFTSVIDENLQ